MPQVRKVDATWARQIAALLDARGKPATALLNRVGLDPAELEDPDARIPFAKQAALLEAAAEASADPCFGLHFGSGLDPLDAGALAYLAASSADLEEAFRNLVSYIRVFSEGVRPHLDVEGRLATLSVRVVDPDVRQRRQTYEFGLTFAMNIARVITSRRLTPEWIEFRHNRSEQLEDFERYFGAPVHFGRARNALVLSIDKLKLPCRSADARLLRILDAYCKEILKQRPEHHDLKYETEYLVATLLPSGSASSRRIAQELGMSERTLSRRLSARGTSFGAIREDVRRSLALRYLQEPEARTSQVAYLLGYSEPAAFNHAFRRWTGQSPTQFVTAG